jgi:hypothetical protein
VSGLRTLASHFELLFVGFAARRSAVLVLGTREGASTMHAL